MKVAVTIGSCMELYQRINLLCEETKAAVDLQITSTQTRIWHSMLTERIGEGG